MTWRELARCAESDPAIWDTDGYGVTDISYAVSLCQACPVKSECAQLAREVKPVSGVWAGRQFYPNSWRNQGPGAKK